MSVASISASFLLKEKAQILRLIFLVILMLVPVVSSVCALAKTPLRECSWEELKGELRPDSGLLGSYLRIQGFVVPLERDEHEALLQFLLVPYFGACIHMPPPPPDQIIEVRLAAPLAGIEAMDIGTVTGQLQIDTSGGASSYLMEKAHFKAEKEGSGRKIVWALAITFVCGLSVALGWVGPLTLRKPDLGLASLAMALAAGMLTGLGLSAVALEMNLKALGFSAVGFGLAFLFLRGSHAGRSASPSAVSLALGVALHNYPECFLVLSVSMGDQVLGSLLAAAMLAHNIPLGISLGVGQSRSAGKSWFCAILAGFVPPLAAVLTFFALRSLVTPEGMRLLMAGAGGVLLALAVLELLPHAVHLGSRKGAWTGFVLGLLLLTAITAFLSGSML